MNALVIAFFAVVAIVAAAPLDPASSVHKEPIAIVSQNSETSPEGSYVQNYETANGIKVHEEAVLKTVDKGEHVLAVKGSSSYTAPDGTPIGLEYYADETGYHASGPHLPVGPPTPEAILKGLKWSEEHPEPKETILKRL